MTESEFDQPQKSPSVKELPSSEASESLELIGSPEQPIEVSPATTPTVEVIDLDTPEVEENAIEAIDQDLDKVKPTNEPENKYVEEMEDDTPETVTEETTSTAPSPMRANSNGGNEGTV